MLPIGCCLSMEYPPSVDRLIRAFKQLPTIGARSAERLAVHVLNRPREEAGELSQALRDAIDQVRPCERCGFFAEGPLCHICQDPRREPGLLAVVQQASDVLVIERSHAFRGTYHVLGGVLSPLDGIGPEELHIPQLIKRIDSEDIREIILALGADVRSETTSLYLANELNSRPVQVSQLATGISVGGPLEFADAASLAHALQDRKAIK
jgi:recombination protein RecR